MANQKQFLQFDHREIAVVFSLFIFVTLLMFTVGIMVGKGISQARYEGVLKLNPPKEDVTAEGPAASTHVSTEEKEGHHAAPAEGETAKAEVHGTEESSDEVAAAEKTSEEKQPLELIPKEDRRGQLEDKALASDYGNKKAADEVLKNPKVRSLVEDAGSTAPNRAAPASGMRSIAGLAAGAYTVQVGSYPAQKDAESRVAYFKKLGFAHAYFSAKDWSEKKETWYRVWLGYFPDVNSAKRAGDFLQQRGEVKNYLVRKSNSTD